MEQLKSLSDYLVVANLKRHKGIVIYIVLVVLVVMSLAALGLMRSVDTGTLISNNISFKQTSLHLADIGTEAAVNELERFALQSADAAYPSNCETDGSCRYYPVEQTLYSDTDPDDIDIPTIIDWTKVAATSSVSFPSTFAGNNVIANGFKVQYVVERLCTGTLPITDPATSCYALTDGDEGGSKKVGGGTFTAATELYYRATIRISDDRNAETFVQVILKR